MKSRRRPIHYYDECWMQSFWFMEGWPREVAAKVIERAGMGTSNITWQQGRTMWKLDGTGPIIIWTKPAKTLAARMSILAHECIHAAHICLDRSGVKPCFDNDEPVTYLVTVLMRKALERC